MKPAGSRQQSGYACEECRRRKARCDRVRPQCGLCAETGTVCIAVGKRSNRGSERGSVDMKRSRPRPVEIGKQPGNEEPNISSMDTDPIRPGPILIGELVANLEHTFQTNLDVNSDDYFAQMSGWSIGDPSCVLSPTLSSEAGLSVWAGSPETPPTLENLKLSDLMWADLDQLYFDRVHPILPMKHQWNYLAWAGMNDLETVPPARACLRAAMRTMAAAMSAQYRGFSGALYTETRRLLEKGCQKLVETPWPMTSDSVPLEKIQAWLLLAHYESLCMDEHQAMLTAGRAFRLVQIARLYDIDAPDDVLSTTGDLESDEAFVEVEERRRTFWVAFTLDRFLCWRKEWPLTLQEEMICTRLPAPDSSFQNSQRTRASFLSQVMAETAPVTLAPFAKCVVMATLHGRCLAHRRASITESSRDPRGFWTRQKSLASIVERCVMQLKQCRTSSATERDSMLLFTHMLAYSAVIHLSSTVQKASFQTVEHQMMTDAAEQRALRAVAEMVRLAKAVPSFWCLKAHPFLPNPLASATMFLISHPNLNEGGEDGSRPLIRLLRNLSDINSLALEPLATAMTLTDHTGN